MKEGQQDARQAGEARRAAQKAARQAKAAERKAARLRQEAERAKRQAKAAERKAARQARESQQYPFELRRLQRRRHQLGMPYEILAKRSGVSVPTLKRMLSGHDTSISSVCAVAAAMGLEMRLHSQVSALQMQETQARSKAKELVAMVQGTSGLEGQAVDKEKLDEMIRRTVHELMAGSKQRLWS